MSEKTLADAIPGGEVDRATDHQADWYYAEGIPGNGPRPEYLEAKYNYVMSEQAKGYKEAQKLIGTNATAPEQYDFTEVQEAIDQDNPHIMEMITHAKEARLQQDIFGKLVKKFVDYDKSRLPDVNEEIAKLGTDGPQKITTIQNWVKNNVSAEAAKALEKLPIKAEVVKMLDEIRQKMVHTQSKLPAGTLLTEQNFKVLTIAEVEAEMLNNYDRYQKDPTYRAQITAKFEQAVGG